MSFSRHAFLLCVLRASAALANILSPSPLSTAFPSTPTRNIKITNNCPEDLYPAIIGSDGTPLGETGFYLASNDARTVVVPSSWVGRVWARTNCTFDGNGRGHCGTGDCDKKLVCGTTSGEKPHTIAEFTVSGYKNETYYDISTVDGYNVDMAIIPEDSAGAVLSCISRPEKGAPHWCPDELLLTPPKEKSKLFFYPDDDIPGEYFSPCHSACSKWGRDQDCCAGEYDSPQRCKPGLYSKRIKNVCPDAYSFAYDDALSTFTLPSGSGFEIMFCPGGKSSITSKGRGKKCKDPEEAAANDAANPQDCQSKSEAESSRSPQGYWILLSLSLPIFLITPFS
ncbi:Osmotin, thaumatin-like protein [Tuber magnatum]|uniref:Osmotin, thaumatin-like protein n=1 Tax=Tuber magnatum TaxID=42249 RepID=A0A317SFK4_9PEZI|nr:Osmotin, thaumatin-like protein [Tuber magnatum]